ncbi:MAG: WYL domain-containing protein [Deltaproteobacteria bacterium]|nr:WYL domain-containing protein [Deltaproteobacteria bacterium]
MDTDKNKRAIRLLKIIQEIKTAPYQTVSQLVISLGISRAQFYKDKAELISLGFEFSYDRSKGRFIITQDPYLPVAGLNLSERLSLLMAVRQLSAAGDYLLTYEGVNAARKLAADLPGPLRESALALFDDLVLKEGFGCSLETMEALQQAVTENRRVMFTYQRPDLKPPTQEELDPYHLFFQRRALYVEGFSWTHKSIRMYRLNRIQHVRLTGLRFTRRTDYSFGRRHRNAFSVFSGETTQRVSIRFSRRVRAYIQEALWHHSQTVREDVDGCIIFEVDVAEPREVMWWAFQWGAAAEILSPDWLREEAKQVTAEMANRYLDSKDIE